MAAEGDVQAAYYCFLSEAGADLGTVGAPLPQEDLEAAALAGASTSSGKGRKRIKLLADGDSDDDLSEEEEEGGKKGGRKRSDSSRASQKASREKLRREKINDRFIELALLVEPNKEPKTDKLTVLSEAIRTVQQLQVENHQLKQLNKFLEEKTASMERDRAQAMYFQMQAGMMGGGGMMMQQPAGMMMQQPAGMMMQQPGPMMMAAAPVQPGAMQPGAMQPGAMQPGAMMMQAPPMMMAPHPQQQPPAGMGPADAMAMPRTQSSGAMGAAPQQQPQQPQQQPQQQQGYAPAMPDVKLPVDAMAGGGMPGQPGAPGYWQSMVQQTMLDANQDSLLRPPAA